MNYYHMDINYKPLPEGTMLKPNEGKTWNELVDQFLELFRPPQMLPRQRAVFMVDSIWTFPEVGMPEEGWVYEVKPSGKVEYHDVGWFIQIYHEFEGLRTMDEVKDHLEFDDVAEEYAKRYWSGSDFGQGAWEYLTPTGVIIKNLGRMEDLMKGELDEMRKRAGIVV